MAYLERDEALAVVHSAVVHVTLGENSNTSMSLALIVETIMIMVGLKKGNASTHLSQVAQESGEGLQAV